MSETNQNNPNRTPSYTSRRLVAAAVITAAATGGGIAAKEAGNTVKESVNSHKEHKELVENLQRPDALRAYRVSDEIPHEKAVVLQAPESMTPFEFASEINAEGVDLRDITAQITPQADAQVDPGLQPNEQVVVEKALVDPEAIEKYGVPDISNSGQNPESGNMEQLPQ